MENRAEMGRDVGNEGPWASDIGPSTLFRVTVVWKKYQELAESSGFSLDQASSIFLFVSVTFGKLLAFSLSCSSIKMGLLKYYIVSILKDQ